jgi:zinc transporter ZupT
MPQPDGFVISAHLQSDAAGAIGLIRAISCHRVPKEFAQILPIFLSFSKIDAVESAASGKNG